MKYQILLLKFYKVDYSLLFSSLREPWNTLKLLMWKIQVDDPKKKETKQGIRTSNEFICCIEEDTDLFQKDRINHKANLNKI